MAATRDFSALVRVVDEHEHQRLTRHLAEGLIEHLDPADLAKALRQANTRVRRDLLQHAGLPYRQPPPPTLCRQLIDKVKAPEACPTLHPMLCRAIGSAYERRLHKLVEGTDLDGASDDPDAFRREIAHRVEDIPPVILAYAVLDWLTRHRHKPTSPQVLALIHLVQVSAPFATSDGGTRDLEDLIAEAMAAARDDAGLAMARHLIASVSERWPQASAALARVSAFASESTEPSLLLPIGDDLRGLVIELERQRRMVAAITALEEQEDGGHVTLVDVRSLVAELEAAERSARALDEILRLDGPDDIAAELAEIKAAAREARTNHGAASDGLCALLSVVKGESAAPYDDIATFIAEFPDMRAVVNAALKGEVAVRAEEGTETGTHVADDPHAPIESAEDAASAKVTEDAADDDGSATTSSDDGDPSTSEPTATSTPDTSDEPRRSTNAPDDDAVDSTHDEPDTGTSQSGPAPAEEADPASATDVRGDLEPVETPSAAETGDEADDDPADGDVDERLDTALARALEDGRFGLAAHIAEAQGELDRATAFRLAALATEARAAAGPCATRFKELLDDAEVPPDPASRLVLLPAALRMALVAPYSGSAALAARLSSTLPELQPLIDATLRASQQGVALIDDVLTVAADLDQAARAVDEATEAIRAHLATAGARTIKYQRATDVWKTLIGNGGILRDYLTPALTSHASDEERLDIAKRMRDQAAELSTAKRRDAEIANADTSKKRKAIHSGAAAKLTEYWDETVQLGVTWADAVIAADRARSVGEGSWQQREIDALRRAHDQTRGAVAASLDEIGHGDPLLRGAVCAARHLLDSVKDLLSGVRPDGGEPAPDRVLNADLLAAAPFRLNDDFTIGRVVAESVADDLDDVASRSFTDGLLSGFDRRTELHDHVGTALVIQVLREAGHPEVEALDDRRTEALVAARHVVAERWSAARDRLESDRRLGFLDETRWRLLTAKLEDHDPTDREDLDRVDDAVQEVFVALEENRRETLAEFRDHLDSLADDPTIATVREKVLARVEAGDLATAWEYLSLAREGSDIPESVEEARPAEFLAPRLDDALSGINLAASSTRQTVRRRARLGPLDFASLDDDAAETVISGLRAWRDISREDDLASVDWEQVLPPVLRVLGMSAARIRPAAENRPNVRNHQWIDLVSVEVDGDPLVPTFAPEPGGHTVWKVLVNSGPPDTVETYLARARIGEPVFLLHLRPLGSKGRAKLARTFRENRRAVAIIDSNVMAWVAATGPGDYERTMQAVLPFVTANPYMPDAYGLVPESMFYGRTAELDRIVRQHGGTSYVYGGRQLGKSALLRHAKRVFERDPDHVAIYIDLKAKQVGRPRPADAVWEELWTALVAEGIAEGEAPRRLAPSVTTAITTWLGGDPGRRLLVLLDECDHFIEADSKGDLAVSASLKGLMEETQRRCKIVFAGLHTVQRFSTVARSVSNTPLAHLGEPLAIGPLDGRHAAELVTRPLNALGYRFESFELVNRILAHTNRQPALLVIFMHHLLERLNDRRRWRNDLPTIVTGEDVDSTWADPTVTAAIRERVSLTLRLDPAFHVIAHVVAYNHHLHGHSYLTPATELRDDCAEYWPAGFSKMQMTDFMLVADEMIGLGVLAKDGNSYMLRSPNVARLLGSREDIEQVLLDATDLEPADTFEPSRWRRDLTTITNGRRSRPVRAPLTDAQLADIVSNATQAHVVVATKATGADRVDDAIQSACSARTVHRLREASDPNITSYLRPLGDGRHRVTVVRVTGSAAEVAWDTLQRALDAVDPGRRHNPQAGTFEVIFLADPVVDGTFIRRIFTSGESRRVPISAAGLWSAEAIANFGRDAALPFDSHESARRVLEATGGWDVLVTAVAQACADGSSLNAALDQVDISQLAASIDLRSDQRLKLAYERAALVLDDGDEPAEELAEVLADDLGPGRYAADGDPLTVARALVDQMVLTGLLVDVGDARVRAEPVARAALVPSV